MTTTYAMNMNATGTKQGAFAKGVLISSLSHSIVSPRDAVSGLPSGHRQHAPISVAMTWGPTTAKFLRAYVTGETLTTVTINLLQNGIVVATVTLTNAHILEYDESDQSVALQMSYQKITWLWKSGAISVSDDWALLA